MYVRGSAMIILVYDVNSTASYDELCSKWLPYIKLLEKNAFVCIVETKIDLVNSKEGLNTEQARQLANENGYLFWRVSSKSNIYIQKMFDEISKKLIAESSAKLEISSNILY